MRKLEPEDDELELVIGIEELELEKDELVNVVLDVCKLEPDDDELELVIGTEELKLEEDELEDDEEVLEVITQE